MLTKAVIAAIRERHLFLFFSTYIKVNNTFTIVSFNISVDLIQHMTDTTH